MSRPATHPFLQHDGFIAFAHRGGAGEHPENSMAAFEAVVAMGYRYLETDVHATRDGMLLAFHDDRLERVTDGFGSVAALSYDEVRRLRIGSSEPIPLLEEVLGAWPDLRINIDPKNDSAVAPLAEALRRADALDRVCIGSFSGARLARLRRMLGPRLCTSMGPFDVTRMLLARHGLPVGDFAACCVQVPPVGYGLRVVDRRLVEAAHARGLQVHVWTIDDEQEMERLIDLGVDGLMSDRPTRLKRVLQSHGLWA